MKSAVITLNTIEQKRKKVGEDWELAENVFSENCEVRNLREKTLEYYNNALKSFLKFIKNTKIPPMKISTEIIEKYILHLKNKRENTIQSINTNLRGLRAFLNFLFENEYIDKKLKIKMLKTENPVIKTFTEEQLKILLEKPYKNTRYKFFRMGDKLHTH